MTKLSWDYKLVILRFPGLKIKVVSLSYESASCGGLLEGFLTRIPVSGSSYAREEHICQL